MAEDSSNAFASALARARQVNARARCLHLWDFSMHIFAGMLGRKYLFVHRIMRLSRKSIGSVSRWASHSAGHVACIDHFLDLSSADRVFQVITVHVFTIFGRLSDSLLSKGRMSAWPIIVGKKTCLNLGRRRTDNGVTVLWPRTRARNGKSLSLHTHTHTHAHARGILSLRVINLSTGDQIDPRLLVLQHWHYG